MPTTYQILIEEKAGLVRELRELNDKGAKGGLDDAEKSAREEKFDRLEDINIALENEEKIQAYERSLESVPDFNEAAPKVDTPAPQPAPKFSSLGEQLQSVYFSAVPDANFRDERLRSAITGPAVSPAVGATATGLGETISSDGGFLVQQEQAAGIEKRMYELGQVLSRCRRISLGANSNGFKMNMFDETSRANGSRFGGVQGYWVGEADEITATKPKFRQWDKTLGKVVGLVYVTDELLADAVALEATVNEALPEELTFKVEDAVFNGTGGGMPDGIIGNDAVVSVDKETGQTAATVTYNNVKSMWARMWARSRQNMIWAIDQSVEPELYGMSLNVGTGGAPVFLPAGGASSQPFATLFGRPIVPIEYGAALGTVGDIMAVDLSQYLLIEKGGIQSAASMHVRFLYDEMAFRFVYRINGAPLWESALTPKSGASTLSPYVTLATRA